MLVEYQSAIARRPQLVLMLSPEIAADHAILCLPHLRKEMVLCHVEYGTAHCLNAFRSSEEVVGVWRQ
jgi:hypothetical protein